MGEQGAAGPRGALRGLGAGRREHERLGEGDPRGSPFSYVEAFPAHKYYGLFLLFNRRFLSLMMDNLIFCLRLVARTVDTSAQAGLWGVIRRFVVDNRGNDAHNGRVTKSKHSDEAARSVAALSFKRRRYEPGY